MLKDNNITKHLLFFAGIVFTVTAFLIMLKSKRNYDKKKD
jgi:hypothetical protein